MLPEETPIAIARRIRDILECGSDLSPEVMRFIDTTFSDPSADEIAAILGDESNNERDSLLELLFSPDESVHLEIEKFLLLPTAHDIDPNQVAELLCRPALRAGFRMPDGRGWLRVEITPALAGRFVHQLRMNRRIPGSMAAAIDARLAGQERLRLRALIRGARFDLHPPHMEFLNTLIERLGLEDEEGWACFAFALEVLVDIGHEADIYEALAERKKLLTRALNQGRRQREHLAVANIESLLSRGQRLTNVDEAAMRRQMAFIDQLCLTAFGRIAPVDSHGMEAALEFSDPQDLTDFMRRLT
ncbi:MAG: hypothetical protein ACM3KE_09180 [Hyphomicrobiales bacterium]